MSDYRKLIEVFVQELGHQEQLLKLLMRERAAIVELNQDEIKQVTDEKEVLYQAIQQSGAKRSQVILDFVGELSISDPVHLTKIIEACPRPDIKEELASLQGELIQVSDAAQEMNANNALLIKQTIGLVSSTLSIFCGGASPETETYGPEGNIRKEEDPQSGIRRSMLSKEV